MQRTAKNIVFYFQPDACFGKETVDLKFINIFGDFQLFWPFCGLISANPNFTNCPRHQAEKIQNEWKTVSNKPVLCNGENLLNIISKQEAKLNKYYEKCTSKIEAVKALDSKKANFEKLKAKHTPKLQEIFNLKKQLKMASENLASGQGVQPSVAQTKEWLEILEKQSLELEDIKRDGGGDLVDEIVKGLGDLNELDCLRLLNKLSKYKFELDRAEVGEWKEYLVKEMKPKLVKRETMVSDMAEVENLMDEIMRMLENGINREMS